MSTVLPSSVRACTRMGVRVVFAGALAIGLLTSGPASDAHAATDPKPTSVEQQYATTTAKRGTSARRVARAITVATHQKGDRYSYGAAGPNRFDCSGLTYFSFRKAGFKKIPRTSSAQSHYARKIPRNKMHRGDLIFFRDGGGVYHVGLFAGSKNGRRMVLHAPYSGTRVRTERIWTNNWFPGTLRYR